MTKKLNLAAAELSDVQLELVAGGADRVEDGVVNIDNFSIHHVVTDEESVRLALYM